MMLRTVVFRSTLLAAIWWILTGGAMQSWAVGLPTIALAVAVSMRLRPPTPDRLVLSRFPRFFFYFLWRSLRGGIQVATMALRPRLDLQPAMLEIDLRLGDEGQRLFLANLLNLLPGTLSAGLEGTRLHLHVLDQRMPIEREVRSAEARVAWLFGDR